MPRLLAFILFTSKLFAKANVGNRRHQYHALRFLDHEGVAGEIDYIRALVAKWKQEHGQDVHFTSSFAGSETVTNQILNGVPAEIAILSIDGDAQRSRMETLLLLIGCAAVKGIVN